MPLLHWIQHWQRRARRDNLGKTDIFFRELGNFTNHKWQRLYMLESRYFANFMKIDIALVQSYMNLALTINVFQVEFENTIYPQSLECHIIFSPSSTPSLPNCKLSLFSNADQEMTLYCPKHCLIMKKLVLIIVNTFPCFKPWRGLDYLQL